MFCKIHTGKFRRPFRFWLPHPLDSRTSASNAGAKFSLGIFFIAGTLLGLAHFYFTSSARHPPRSGCSSSGRGCRFRRNSRCGVLRCSFLSHSGPLFHPDSICCSPALNLFVRRHFALTSALRIYTYSTRIIAAGPCYAFFHSFTGCNRSWKSMVVSRSRRNTFHLPPARGSISGSVNLRPTLRARDVDSVRPRDS